MSEVNETAEHDPLQGESDSIRRIRHQGPPTGIRRGDRDGWEIVDAMAGRASVFGFGFEPIVEAIKAAAKNYLGDASSFGYEVEDQDDTLVAEFREWLGRSSGCDVDSLIVCASADMAVETAIGLARRYRPQRFRTIAMVGSDHGRTGTCRTASGRPELHDGYGPMMAGFAHVPVGDLDAVRGALDENTACVLLSPIDLGNAAKPVEEAFLIGLREICDAQEILLVVDESQLSLGCTGRSLAFTSIADVTADLVIVSGGLFAGLPGGVVIAAEHATQGPLIDVSRYPLLSAVGSATLSSLVEQGLPEAAIPLAQDFAVALAEKIAGFEFVRDLHATGMTIGIETDLESANIVRVANQYGLRMEQAGNTAIRIQLPLVLSDNDRDTLMERLGRTLAALERDTAEIGA